MRKRIGNVLLVVGFLASLFLLGACGKTEGVRANLRTGGVPSNTALGNAMTVVPPGRRSSPFNLRQPQTHATTANPLEILVSDKVERLLRLSPSNFQKSQSCFIADQPLVNSGAEIYYYASRCDEVHTGMRVSKIFTVYPIVTDPNVAVESYELAFGRDRIGLVTGFPADSRGIAFSAGSANPRTQYQITEFCSGAYPCRPTFTSTGEILNLFER